MAAGVDERAAGGVLGQRGGSDHYFGSLLRREGSVLAVDGCQVGLHDPGHTEVTVIEVSASAFASEIVTLLSAAFELW